jgi:hypothetical protein
LGIKSANGSLNILQPPLKFEIRRQLVSAGVCGLKFNAAEYLALFEPRKTNESNGQKYPQNCLSQIGRCRIPGP